MDSCEGLLSTEEPGVAEAWDLVSRARVLLVIDVSHRG